MSILENLKKVLPSWAEVKERELPHKMEYEINLIRKEKCPSGLDER